MKFPTLKTKNIDWTVVTAYAVLIAVLVCLVIFAPWFFCGLGIGLLFSRAKVMITMFIDMQDERPMSTDTVLEEVIELAETATDADYHKKPDAIIAKAKAAKLQLNEDDETAKEFDVFEEPEA